ncbi:MAG: hypothetical protein ABIN01_21770, partial [Ferruginibacter sp.]
LAFGLRACQLAWLRCSAAPGQHSKTKENKLPVNTCTPQQYDNIAVDEIDEHANIYFIKQ